MYCSSAGCIAAALDVLYHQHVEGLGDAMLGTILVSRVEKGTRFLNISLLIRGGRLEGFLATTYCFKEEEIQQTK